MYKKEESQTFVSGKRVETQSNFTLVGRIYYSVLKNFFARIFAWIWLCKVKGEENIPKEGAFLIAPNHQSYLDFLLIIFVFRKSINLTFFIKKPYFNKLIWKHFLVQMGQIMADRRSIGKAISLLRDGQAPVVLFAEGTRTSTGEIGELNRSLAVIAEKIPDLKIIPVGIVGAFEAWPAGQKFPRLGKKIKISIAKGVSFADIGGDKAYFLGKIKRGLTSLAE